MPATVRIYSPFHGMGSPTFDAFSVDLGPAAAQDVVLTEDADQPGTYLSAAINITGLHSLQVYDGVAWRGSVWADIPADGEVIASETREAAMATDTGAGTGARTISVTVDDGAIPIEDALVRFTKGAESYVQPTDVDGEVVFGLDDGTWNVVVTRPGYTFAPTTLVVNGNETITYSMTQVSFSVSDPGQVVGYLYCYDEEANVEADVEIHLKQIRKAESTGVAYDGETRTEISGADGLVQFTGIFQGGRYELWRGDNVGNKVTVNVPTDADDPYKLSSVVGYP